MCLFILLILSALLKIMGFYSPRATKIYLSHFLAHSFLKHAHLVDNLLHDQLWSANYWHQKTPVLSLRVYAVRERAPTQLHAPCCLLVTH